MGFYQRKNTKFLNPLLVLFWLLPVDRTGRPSLKSVDRVGRPTCTECARQFGWRAGRPTRSTARELLLSGKPRSTGPVDRQRALLSVSSLGRPGRSIEGTTVRNLTVGAGRLGDRPEGQICPLAAGKGIFALPVDRPVDWPNSQISDRCASSRPARSTETGYRKQSSLPVDRPGRPGPFPESRALWTVDRPVDWPTSPGCVHAVHVGRSDRSTDFCYGRPVRSTGRQPVQLIWDIKTWLFIIK